MIEQPKKPFPTDLKVHQGHQVELKHLGMPHVPSGAFELMDYRHPDHMLPLDETLKLYPKHSLDELEEKGVPREDLQRIAFSAVCSAHHQHSRRTPLASEPVETLAERFANNALSQELARLAGVEVEPSTPIPFARPKPGILDFLKAAMRGKF